MNQTNYQKLLLRSALCVMACDGKIHEEEIKEIKKISTTTPYFKKIDYANEIATVIADISKHGTKTIKEHFIELKESSLIPVQELLLLEVLMRIINADKVKDPNEIIFLQIVKSGLKVHDEIVMERFGNTDLLFDRDYKQVDKSFKNKFISELKLPKLKDLKGYMPDIQIRMD